MKWAEFFAAQRFKLWASRKFRPGLFDVMSSYGLWKENIMSKILTLCAFHGCFSVVCKKCVFDIMHGSNKKKTKHLHSILTIIHQPSSQDVPWNLRNIPKAFCSAWIQNTERLYLRLSFTTRPSDTEPGYEQ